jgi:sulfur-oxidizing protein SoxA
MVDPAVIAMRYRRRLSDGRALYRLEWQSMGSLHRRLRACSLGVRTQVLDYGAPEYLALERYLAWRAPRA